MADKLVDLIGIGNLLESLVAEDIITCEERDRVIAKIARENDIAEHEYKSPHIAGYGMSKREVLERVGRRSSAASQDESYISLTEIARAHSEDAPGYVIQRWLRSENTLAFLNLWEKENNPDYSDVGYIELLEKKKTASFCKELGLNITELESDQTLQELVLSVHHAFIITIDATAATKLIENQNGARYITSQKK